MTDQDITMSELTPRQVSILSAVQTALDERGFPPSVREIAAAVGLASPSTVKHHLDALVDAGFLQRLPGMPRAMELSEQARLLLKGNSPEPPQPPASASTQTRVVTIELPTAHTEDNSTAVPLVGRIAAGVPITAEQCIEDVFQIPRQLTGSGTLFMLEVSGDSMMDAGIFDGDFVVIRSQNTANNGDFVAAMLDGEATVKEFRHTDGHVWLLPHNPDYDPIDGNHATILGKVVTVLRSL